MMRPLRLGLAMAVLMFLTPLASSNPAAPVRPRNLPARAVLPNAVRSMLGGAFAGQIRRVPAGGDLQAALNAARPGDFIELPAGATFVGNFTLPTKPGTAWIVIYSSAVWRLPPPGTRVSPDHARFMPKLVSPNAAPVIAAAEAAHHYAFVGIEFTTTSRSMDDLLYLDFRGQSRLEQVPTDIVFYQCYIHGTPTGEIRRGVALNGARLAVIGSYLSDFHTTYADSHAIQGWNGPGPFWIIGNYLEGAGENVMFGGDDPLIHDLVPSDIVIRGNHFAKPRSWREGDPAYAGVRWVVKNLFELKNARRVLVEGNLFEHSWPQTQFGFAILLTPRNQFSGAPWSTVEDVTLVNNVIRHSTGGITFLGWDDLCAPVPGATACSGQLKRILIRNNLFEDIGAYAEVTSLPEEGTVFLLADGPADVVIDHNTVVQTGRPIVVTVTDNERDRWPAPGFVVTNNIVLNNQGVGNNQGIGGGPIQTLNTYFRSTLFTYVFTRNVLVGGSAATYPPDNFFPASVDQVGFMDYGGGDYRLGPASPFRDLGTDGQDIGVDVSALAAALLRWW